MFPGECATTKASVVFITMPLQTELVSSEAGVCYRHGVTNGAVPVPHPCVSLQRAQNTHSWCKMLIL